MCCVFVDGSRSAHRVRARPSMMHGMFIVRHAPMFIVMHGMRTDLFFARHLFPAPRLLSSSLLSPTLHWKVSGARA